MNITYQHDAVIGVICATLHKMPSKMTIANAMPLPNQFIHRYLEPFYESFCRVCARTVGMAKEESQLARNEKDHTCDPSRVAMLRTHGIDPEVLLKVMGKM